MGDGTGPWTGWRVVYVFGDEVEVIVWVVVRGDKGWGITEGNGSPKTLWRV